MQLLSVKLPVTEGCNVILGQSHFIKTAEDLYETLAESSSAIKFGIAFCEASGKCLVRSEGNDAELKKKAEEAALKIGAGHSFIVIIKNAFPVNVLNRIKGLSEVCSIYCATANPVEVIIAETENGRGILGVVDGSKPKGIETEADVAERKALLRKFGYKR